MWLAYFVVKLCWTFGDVEFCVWVGFVVGWVVYELFTRWVYRLGGAWHSIRT